MFLDIIIEILFDSGISVVLLWTELRRKLKPLYWKTLFIEFKNNNTATSGSRLAAAFRSRL